MIRKANIGENKQPSFVGAYYLDDIALCDDIMSAHDIDGGVPGSILGADGGNISDLSIKDSSDVRYGVDHPLYLRYLGQLSLCLNQYKRDFEYSDSVRPYSVESMQSQRYKPGGAFYKYHCERTGPEKANRHLVYMTYLNDIDDAGETDFVYQGLRVKPKKGLTLIWPADWTHTHRGIPSPTETKYIVTGWWHFDVPLGNKYTIVL